MTQDAEPRQPPEGSTPGEETREDRRDVRVIIVVVVILALLVIAYVLNRGVSAPSAPTVAPSQPGKTVNLFGRESGTAAPASEGLPFGGLLREYPAYLERERRTAAEFTYRAAERDFVVAIPPHPTPGSEASKGQAVRAGELFEVSKRASGVEVGSFQRRFMVRIIPPQNPREGPRTQSFLIFKDSVKAIGLGDELKPVWTKVEDVKETDDPTVLGLVHRGEARAYSLRLLNYHEIINDTVGGDPVAVTWNPLAGAATALVSRAGDQPRYLFGSSGLLYRGDTVMYDRATGSLWSPQLGLCLAGELAGTRLQPIPLVITSLAFWRQTHPDSLVLTGTEPLLDSRDIMPVPIADYMTNRMRVVTIVGYDATDDRLHPKDLVYGVAVNGAAKAYPVPVLAGADAKLPLQDTIGGKAVSLLYDKEGRFAIARDADGNDLRCRRMFYMFWQALYPQTEVYGREKTTGTPPSTEGQRSSAAAGAGQGLPVDWTRIGKSGNAVQKTESAEETATAPTLPTPAR